MNDRHHPLRRRARGQRGIALIEALVGILIFTFGVLGLIGLQGSMTRAQTSSKLRGDATNLASEIIGQMWSDTSNVASYGNCASYAPCKAWQDKVAAILPGGTATTVVTAANAVEITLTWKLPGAIDTQSYYTSTTVSP